MAKRSVKSVSKSLDSLWSKIVRKRDPKCCKCGKPTTEAHHIFGRRAMATRWELDNGLGLCAYCHKFDKFGFEQDPYNLDNVTVITKKIGEERFGELRRQHLQIKKRILPDLLELEQQLKSILNAS